MAKCRRCGGESSGDQMVLDPVYKMVVCPLCVKERKLKEQQKKNPELEIEEEKKKPAGWDKEDEYLERAYRSKVKSVVKVQKIDEDTVKYPCSKCGYNFKYSLSRQKPSNCPYCGESVKEFSL